MLTPRELGYHMPAEWEPHEATWLAWPKDPDTFPPDILGPVEQIYLRLIEALTNEKVQLLVDHEQYEKRVFGLLDEREISKRNLFLHRIKTADVWLRDYGPIFIRKDRPPDIALTKWIFNAWGNKYDELKPDNVTGEAIASLIGCPAFRPGIVLEGGSIDVNGQGTCLTTEQCLLNKNRNPDLNRNQIETYLREYLGLEQIIWLKEGVVGDDTDGHIDDLGRFVDPTTVVCAVEENANDENYRPLKTNFKLLETARDQSGQKLNVIPLPMPGRDDYHGRRLPASYANFYIANGVVLVPIFNHANDEKALKIIEAVFPSRKAVGIHCTPLVAGFGAIHCVTQQQPSL